MEITLLALYRLHFIVVYEYTYAYSKNVTTKGITRFLQKIRNIFKDLLDRRLGEKTKLLRIWT